LENVADHRGRGAVVRGDMGRLDAQFKSLLKHHWMEEASFVSSIRCASVNPTACS
jgi:hypothetical protein